MAIIAQEEMFSSDEWLDEDAVDLSGSTIPEEIND